MNELQWVVEISIFDFCSLILFGGLSDAPPQTMQHNTACTSVA